MGKRILKKVALIVFVLAMPLLIFSVSVRLVVNDLNVYNSGLVKYDIPRETGIALAELERVDRELVQYFNSNEEYLDIVLSTGVPLYNQKEISHLKDVKDLVKLDYRLQWLTLAYVVGYALIVLVWQRSGWRRALAGLGRTIMFGGGLTLTLMAILGLALFVAFDRVFLAFHLLGFSNLLWVLDPATDRLIQMFPQGFFYDAALRLAGITLVIALVVSVVGWGLELLQKKIDRYAIAAIILNRNKGHGE